jgi:hypothetical protein
MDSKFICPNTAIAKKVQSDMTKVEIKLDMNTAGRPRFLTLLEPPKTNPFEDLCKEELFKFDE